MKTFRQRLRSLWRRPAVKREIDEELRFHLDQRTAENIAAGMAPEDAAREARRRFGNMQKVREQCRESRGASFGEATLRDLRFAFRQLLKNPGFTAIAVLVLALGIGANTAIFSLINAFLFKPIVALQPDRLVGIYSHDVEHDSSWREFSIPNFQDLQRQSDVFDGIFAMSPNQVGLAEGETTRRVASLTVSANFFEVLGVHPSLGRTFLPEENSRPSPVVIASYHWWERHGADPGVIGHSVRINGKPFTVIGITPPGFTSTTPMFMPELFLPLGARLLEVRDGSNPLLERDNHGYILVGRLKQGLDLAEANTRLKVISAQLATAYPDVNRNQIITVDRLPRMSISSTPANDRAMVGRIGGLLLGLAGAVLCIACLNLANMQLARGAARRREIAVRIALGAGRGRIIRQLLTEALLLALLGGIAGLCVADALTGWLSRSVARITSNALFIPTVTEWPVLLMTLCACALATLVFALGPAIRLARPDVNHDLKVNPGEDAHSGSRGFFLVRNVLVVGQVALSLALLVAAGLFGRSAFHAMHFNPGFNLQGSIYTELDAGLVAYSEQKTRQRYGEVLDRVRELPGVDSASLAATVPLGELSVGEGVQLGGAPFPAPPEAKTPAEGMAIGTDLNVIGPDYFRTVGMPLLRGREFTQAELQSNASSRIAIINTELARMLWPKGDALGQHIQIGAGDEATGGPGGVVGGQTKPAATVLEVVGVVPSHRNGLFQREAQPMLYLPYGRRFFSAMILHVRAQPTAGMEELLKDIQTTIRQVDPNLPVLKTQSLQSHLETSVDTWVMRTGAVLFGSLGASALLLAMLGVYGVKAYSVARRTREIGIRMALGSTTREVVFLFLRDGMKLTVVGLVIGGALAVGVSLAMGSLLFDVNRFDPLVFITAPLFLAVASLAATWLPARRAAKVDPLIALRSE